MKAKLDGVNLPRILIVSGGAVLGLIGLGVPGSEAVLAVVWAGVGALDPMLADAFAVLVPEFFPELVPRGVDAIVTAGASFGEEYGVVGGIALGSGVGAIAHLISQGSSRLSG